MYSPWRVKPAIARAYNVPLEMSDSLRHRIENMREDYLNERKAMIKRAHEGEEEGVVSKGPPKKKHRKNPEEEGDSVRTKKGEKGGSRRLEYWDLC